MTDYERKEIEEVKENISKLKFCLNFLEDVSVVDGDTVILDNVYKELELVQDMWVGELGKLVAGSISEWEEENV